MLLFTLNILLKRDSTGVQRAYELEIVTVKGSLLIVVVDIAAWCFCVFYWVLETSKVIPAWVATCDSAHSS